MVFENKSNEKILSGYARRCAERLCLSVYFTNSCGYAADFRRPRWRHSRERVRAIYGKA